MVKHRSAVHMSHNASKVCHNKPDAIWVINNFNNNSTGKKHTCGKKAPSKKIITLQHGADALVLSLYCI